MKPVIGPELFAPWRALPKMIGIGPIVPYWRAGTAAATAAFGVVLLRPATLLASIATWRGATGPTPAIVAGPPHNTAVQRMVRLAGEPRVFIVDMVFLQRLYVWV